MVNTPRTTPAGALATSGGFILPAVIADQGDKAAERFQAGTSCPNWSWP